MAAPMPCGIVGGMVELEADREPAGENRRCRETG